MDTNTSPFLADIVCEEAAQKFETLHTEHVVTQDLLPRDATATYVRQRIDSSDPLLLASRGQVWHRCPGVPPHVGPESVMILLPSQGGLPDPDPPGHARPLGQRSARQ